MKRSLVIVIIGTIVIGSIILSIFWQRSNPTPQSVNTEHPSSAIRYVALGDSYTIGQNVDEADRWPNQLVARLKTAGTDIGIVGNPSVTGYTTQNLITRELPLLDTAKPNFVTILIGVNDYVQGVSEQTFQKNFRSILDSVEAKVAKAHIVVVTIPDYAKTPAGPQFGNPAAASAAIKSFNDFMVQESTSRGILAVDIYPISQKVSTDASLTTTDGLHPSGAQYKLWTDAIYQAVVDAKTFSS